MKQVVQCSYKQMISAERWVLRSDLKEIKKISGQKVHINRLRATGCRYGVRVKHESLRMRHVQTRKGHDACASETRRLHSLWKTDIMPDFHLRANETRARSGITRE